jgi:peroxiredoxin
VGRPALYEAEIEELRASFAIEAAVGTGDQAPDFVLPHAQGAELSLSNLLQSGPAVVTFYRGGWCPYCNLQLRAYQAALPEMTALGARLVAISPQLPDRSPSTAETNALTFDVLSEVGNTVARRFGLFTRYRRSCEPRFARMTRLCPTSTATKAGSCRSRRLTSSARTAAWRSPPSISITETASNPKPSWPR